MTFVFPFLLGGLVLVGIPVLIHLIMRQKPKSLPFPAFRFLVQRHRTNQRKLRLRHLLLLALRVLLIAAACLALARPKVFNEALKLGSDRPVAAVLVFDTRPSMEYIVSSARGKLTRLDDAKRRGHELLNQLPDGSKVLILDSADPAVRGKGEWLVSMAQARKRIDGLRIRAGGGPVTARIEDAYRLFDGLAHAKNDETTRRLARLLVVFSDRTRASWDTSRLPELHGAQDRVPPPFERLPSIRDRVPGVVELLGELRSRLPLPTGQDFPEKALIDLLEKARDRASGLSEDEYPDRELSQLIAQARARARELLRAVDKLGEDLPAAAKEYRGKLAGVLRGLLHETRGVHEVYLDVGVDDPADGALLDFELPRDPRRNAPRQVFAADEKVTVRAVVLARGKDVVNVLRWTLDNRKLPDSPPVEVKAGEKATFPLEIDCAQFKDSKGGATHQLQAELVNPDLLANNNVRYLTFAVRHPRHILVITDDANKARRWKEAHDSLRALADFRVTTTSPDKLLQSRKDNPGILTDYQAVYLFDVAEPSTNLWSVLESYVGQGGGLGIVPGGKELVPSAYRSKEAKAVMPGELLGTRDSNRDKGKWDWESIVYQHAMMAPFQAWKGDRGTDFVARPPSAVRYWEVKPVSGKPLVRYVSGDPALLVRTLGKEGRPGKVLLFTTALDEREPAWNDYLSTLTSFPVVLAFVSTSYLAGDAEPVQLNFLSGQAAPVVVLPLGQPSEDYHLWRNGQPIRPVTADPGQNVLRLPQAHDPGNYYVAAKSKWTGHFSVNLPPEEVVPVRLPAADIESLFGQGSVVPVDVRADLRAAMSGQWSQPVELFPFLMVLVLFVLAVENLLANKFYRREPEAAA